MSYYIFEKVEIDKEMIETILNREITDELFDKYIDDIFNSVDGNISFDDFVCENVEHYSSDVLSDLESELN